MGFGKNNKICSLCNKVKTVGTYAYNNVLTW